LNSLQSNEVETFANYFLLCKDFANQLDDASLASMTSSQQQKYLEARDFYADELEPVDFERLCGGRSKELLLQESLCSRISQAVPQMTLNEAKEILIEVEEYQRANLPKFCSALDIPPDDKELFRVSRWSAHDYLHKTHGLEIEELHFFVDFYDMYFRPNEICSPFSPSGLELQYQ
jgi:hypothetical protein